MLTLRLTSLLIFILRSYLSPLFSSKISMVKFFSCLKVHKWIYLLQKSSSPSTGSDSAIWSIEVSHAQEDEPVQEEEVQQGLPRQDQHHGRRAGVQSRLQGTIAKQECRGVLLFPARYCLCNTSSIVPCRTMPTFYKYWEIRNRSSSKLFFERGTEMGGQSCWGLCVFLPDSFNLC